MPNPMVNRLKVNKMPKAISICTISQTAACLLVTCLDGRGRDLVRATSASNFTSEMSFHVQPAPRIRKAPMAQPKAIHISVRLPPAESAATANPNPHQHGISNNQVPAGRSARDRRRYGRDQRGAKRSTQFSKVASATLPSWSGSGI